jgi:hypothetical protein
MAQVNQLNATVADTNSELNATRSNLNNCTVTCNAYQNQIANLDQVNHTLTDNLAQANA